MPPTDDRALREAFDAFDRDGDGFITLDEAHRVFADLNLAVDERRLAETFAAADTDGDGRMDFAEFLATYGHRPG